MKLLSYLERARSLPVRMLVEKAAAKVEREIRYALLERHDARHPTFLQFSPPDLEIGHSLDLPLEALRADAERLAGVTAHYLEHRFDLLGSGWVQVRHGMKCRGLEGYLYPSDPPVTADRAGAWLEGRINPANLAEAQRIWALVDEGYLPIHWQLDFKSGYRWSENLWYRRVAWGGKRGADVKVPWELARMQHLPQLALAYALARQGLPGFEPPLLYERELRNQVLDFVATNPPRFGVNWHSAMEVAIRAANWILAYRLFRSLGATFDREFEVVLARSILEHGRHLLDNLEWAPEIRGNHYLANVVGLLFIAGHLGRNPTTDVWLAFSVQELVREVEYQFNEDGSNFEASTCYHRLSAEMVVYATALVQGLAPRKREALREYDYRRHRVRPALAPAPLPYYRLSGGGVPEGFPEWYLRRLEKMAEFTRDLTKPDGRVAQIGDNDSGRFFKLDLTHHRLSTADAKQRYRNLEGYEGLREDAVYWMEDALDHRHLVAAVAELFARKDLSEGVGNRILASPVLGLASGCRLPACRKVEHPAAAERVRVGSEREWRELCARSAALAAERCLRTEIPIPGGDIRTGLHLRAYPDFGVYMMCSKRIFLAVRCGPIGQYGMGVHAHNDQLGVELAVDGENWIADPGTYLYTPLPERRNQYRSARAHFVPQVAGREPGRVDLGLFRLGNEARAQCLYFGSEGFAGMHQGYGDPVYRLVELRQSSLCVTDFTMRDTLELEGGLGKVAFSAGYGVVTW